MKNILLRINLIKSAIMNEQNNDNDEFFVSKFEISVKLYDKFGNPINIENLEELIIANSFEEEYLNEHLKWDANFISKITIVSIPNNNTIIINIKYNTSISKLIDYLNNFIENEAPYHDYLTLFYQDDDDNQCPLSIDKITLINN